MGEAKRRRRAANVRRLLGDAPLDLCLFPLTAIEPPKSQDDLPLAVWRLQVGLETLQRQSCGELFCVVCDGPIAFGLPPLVGFVRGDKPNSGLCGFAVCETCLNTAKNDVDALTAMVSEAFCGTLAPAPLCN
jgi:hypothetical protein